MNVGLPLEDGGAVNIGYVDTMDARIEERMGGFLNKRGEMAGPISMASQTLKNLPAPTEPADAATKTFVDTGDELTMPALLSIRPFFGLATV